MHNMFPLTQEKCNASLLINFWLMYQSVQISANGVIDYGTKSIISWFSLCIHKLMLYDNLNLNIIAYFDKLYAMFHELLVIIFTSTNWKSYRGIWIRRNFYAHNLHFIQHCNVIISITSSVAVYQWLVKDRLASIVLNSL